MAPREAITARQSPIFPPNVSISKISSSELVHPAVRNSPPEDAALFAPGPCNTPSTRYTDSPAYSVLSYQTSGTSYSPSNTSNMKKSQYREPSEVHRDAIAAISPKSLKSPKASRKLPRAANTDIVAPAPLIPEFAHLDVQPKSWKESSPQSLRHYGHGAGRINQEPMTMPGHLTQPGKTPSSDHSCGNSQGIWKDDFNDPPMSPTSSVSKSLFSWGSRPGSRDSRKRKDSAISSLSPTSPRIDQQIWSPMTNDSFTDLTPCSSQDSLAIKQRSFGRLRKIFERSKDAKERQSPRKGPVAGTGHEGYGKFGFRGRNFSLTSFTGRGRSSSRDSDSSDTSPPDNPGFWSRNTSESEIMRQPASRSGSDWHPPLASSAKSTRTLVKRSSSSETQATSKDHRFSRERGVRSSGETTRYTFAQASGSDSTYRCEVSSLARSGRAQDPETPKRPNFFQRAFSRSKTVDNYIAGAFPELNVARLGYYAHEVGTTLDLDDVNRFIMSEDLHTRSALASLGPQQHLDQQNGSARPLESPSTSDHSVNLTIPQPPVMERLIPSVHHLPRDAPEQPPKGGPREIAGYVPSIADNSRVLRRNAFARNSNLQAQHSREHSDEALSPTGSIKHNDAFLSFPERNNSEISYSSTSGVESLTSNRNQASENDTTGWLGDEDVWNEYNDFIDEVLSADNTRPASTAGLPPSPGSSLGAPFYGDETYTLNRADSRVLPQIHAIIEDIEAPVTNAGPDGVGTPDRLSRFLQPAATPSTPYSLSDIMAGYGDRTASYASSKARQSRTTETRYSTESGYSSVYSRMSGTARPLSKSEGFEAISPVVEESEIESKPEELLTPKKSRRSADADLRFGALMTSKWLSFGRVLFSPAHNEVKTSSDVRVLIVDGLGKDATFYNLEITLADRKSSSRGQDLANYKNVRHASIGSPFPFPRGFFTVVVFRFPVATTEVAYNACIFECKRVLRPGGYLEMSVLDLDMMNMGTTGRRELRSLKLEMHSRNNQVSLRNLGDTMLSLVGRRGFENIQRCSVGIPVAGRIPKSEDGSSDSSERSSFHAAMSAHDRGERITTTDFSGILYGLPSNSPGRARTNDEGITKMVARVGRWWYSTCYGTVAGGEHRLWEQPGLVRECESQGTAFRLLLCYAQKPMCTPRRTASV
ncbi:hypothetical protein ANO11243_014000 [Dothideomycetidae sp. 11243]|nr:hypothetical protein ANO11243_014000 [fungal sp. No.11243]